MSVSSPLIFDWIQNGLEWQYIFAPIIRPFTIPAGKEVELHPGEYRYPEGVLITASAGFDSPKCGIRLRAEPYLDTENKLTVELMTLGNLVEPWVGTVFATMPPDTPPGVYVLRSEKEWPWVESIKITLFNTDTVDHKCIGFSWTNHPLRFNGRYLKPNGRS
ncbi:MAG: hypothetical protein ACTSSA_11500 [Candidatus Freyarchaeota archaeon]